MGPRQAWGALSIVFVLVDFAAAAILIDLGYETAPTLSGATVIAIVYAYVLYKRYHVEVVPENDIMLFEDRDDLRILCRIYGLDDSGETGALRQRLLKFARANSQRAFTWVAPKAVVSFGSALEIQPTSTPRQTTGKALGLPIGLAAADASPAAGSRGLLGGKARSSARLSGLTACPICEAGPPRSGAVCTECGADLEFYAVLQETRIGKRVLARKASAVRRKLRYDVPHLRSSR